MVYYEEKRTKYSNVFFFCEYNVVLCIGKVATHVIEHNGIWWNETLLEIGLFMVSVVSCRNSARVLEDFKEF